MTVYFYGRCSSEENFTKGSSIKSQLSKCLSYANIKDLTIDEEIIEQISGSIPVKKRPKGCELLSKLKKNDEIIVSHLDRWNRNNFDLLKTIESFKKQNVKLHFVDCGFEVTGSDAMGSVFVKLLSIFSEFYAKQCSEKQKGTKQRLRDNGKFEGGKHPYGYDVDNQNNLVPVEKEQQVIRKMQLMKQEGNSYRKIADEITKSTRKKFVVSWVYKILQREGLNLKSQIDEMVALEVA